MTTIVAAIIGATVAIVLAVIAGTLAINNNLAAVKTELAVMGQREKERDEKIDRMWRWWLMTLENGWVAEMKTIAPTQRSMGAGAGQ